MSNIRPMKASPTTVDALPLPCYIGIKYDGIRAIVKDGVVLSLSLKPIRNKAIQEAFGKPEYNGLDGELIIGDIYAKDVFQKTTSVVMSFDKAIDDLQFFVFDDFTNADEPYEKRSMLARMKIAANPHSKLVDATAYLYRNVAEVQICFRLQAELGGEGLIARVPNDRYKFGRSTLKEGFLLKMKFYEQAEFKVVGFTEEMHNANEAQVNELGRTARSSSKDGLVPKDTLGALVVEMEDGRQFNCGTGFSASSRKLIWENRADYLGKWVSIRYMATGIKDLPRHPVFVSFRDEDDINNDY